MLYCEPQGAENNIMETVLYCRLQTEVEKDIRNMAEVFRAPMVITGDDPEQLSGSWKEYISNFKIFLV